MKYLGKTKMYKILKQYAENVPAMKNCEYDSGVNAKFEFIEFGKDGNHYQVYVEYGFKKRVERASIYGEKTVRLFSNHCNQTISDSMDITEEVKALAEKETAAKEDKTTVAEEMVKILEHECPEIKISWAEHKNGYIEKNHVTLYVKNGKDKYEVRLFYYYKKIKTITVIKNYVEIASYGTDPFLQTPIPDYININVLNKLFI